MACRSGFGNCACYTGVSEDFRVKFTFPAVTEFAIDIPLRLSEMINTRPATQTRLEQENVTIPGLLTEEGARIEVGIPPFTGIVTAPGIYFFLTAAEITREIRADELVAINMTQTLPTTAAIVENQALAEYNGTYQAYLSPYEIRPDPFPVEPHDTSLVPQDPRFRAVVIAPVPLDSGDKNGHPSIIMPGRNVDYYQYPANFTHVEGRGHQRHWSPGGLPMDTRVLGPLPAGALILIGAPFGPFRGNSMPLADRFFFTKGAGTVNGYEVLFKRDYEQIPSTGHALYPGMDYFASRYWSGATVTVSGRFVKAGLP